MHKKYQMTTVYKFAEIVENDLTAKEKSIKNAVEKYLSNARRANTNADLLEELLA